MGAVYVVEQVSTGSARALKMMHPEMVQDARSRERFAQEARISSPHRERPRGARSSPPAWTTRRACPGSRWSCSRGETLAAAVERRGALPVGEVVEVFRQLGHALGQRTRWAWCTGISNPRTSFSPRRAATASRSRSRSWTSASRSWCKSRGCNPRAPTCSARRSGWRPSRPRRRHDHPGDGRLRARACSRSTCSPGRYYWRLANTPNVGAGVLVEVLTGVTDAASARAAAVGSHVRPPPAFDAWFARCTARASEQRYRDATEAVGALIQILGGLAAPTLASTPGLRAYTPPTPARGFAAPPYAPGQAAPGYATPASFAAQPPSQPGVPVHRTQVANPAQLPFAAQPPSYPGHNGFAAQQPSQGGFAAQPGSHPGFPVAPQNAGGTGAFRTQMTPWPPHGQPPGPSPAARVHAAGGAAAASSVRGRRDRADQCGRGGRRRGRRIDCPA